MTDKAATTNPLVSAIIPCYNAVQYLAEAIGTALGQTYGPVEVIVVDDGSTDHSPDVIRSFGSLIRSCRQPNRGAAAARNRGVELAMGRFVSFLDADDLWPVERLSVQMAALRSCPSLGIVCGHVEQFVSPELPAEVHRRFVHVRQSLPARVAGAMLIRREEFERVGEFSTDVVTGESLDWTLRALDLGVPMRVLPDIVLRRRIHTTNHGLLRPEARRDYIRVLKSALDRRRERPQPTPDNL
jgi:glycosyltransferase involved in cell wall biosynthesis